MFLNIASVLSQSNIFEPFKVNYSKTNLASTELNKVVDDAKIIDVNTRTLRDWSKEKKRMSYLAALILSKKTNTDMPKDVKILKWKDHLRSAGIKGGKNRYAKHFFFLLHHR